MSALVACSAASCATGGLLDACAVPIAAPSIFWEVPSTSMPAAAVSRSCCSWRSRDSKCASSSSAL
eukprot:3060389-Pyramimonas_sp.AAC.1